MILYVIFGRITVTAGQTTPVTPYLLPQATIISGTVVDENNNPIDGMTITLADGSYLECSWGDGSYRIWVPVGDHIVKA